MVTGYDEAVAVYHDTAVFSSCNSVTGPFPGFPVPLVGDDVSELIERHRDELPFSDQLPTFDPPKHTDHRALLMRLITPKRLKENEEFMWRLADRQIDEFLPGGRCELVGDFAKPFAMLVIADLLGVPEEDHEEFRSRLGGGGHAEQNLGSTKGDVDGAQPVGVPLPTVHCVHRGPTAQPARRRHDRARHRHLPRRLHARGHRRRARRRQPVRRRAGDHCASARRRHAAARRGPGAPAAPARRARPHPELRRGVAPAREPGEGRLPTGPGPDRRRRRRHPRGHHPHGAERRRQP